MDNKEGVLVVTGVSGRIGRAVVDRFGDRFRIIGLDLNNCQHTKDIEYIHVDVASKESVKAAFQELKELVSDKIVSVLHLAAYYSFSQKESPLYEKITVQGTKHILEALQAFECEQFIFASTLLVFKPCQVGEKINEDSTISPRWAYPKSKVKTEAVIDTFAKQIPTVVMRVAGCYDDMCHSIPIAQDIKRIYLKEFDSYFYPGNVNAGNPFLHMDDLMDAFQIAINRRKKLNSKEVFIISEDKTLSYKELQNKISTLLFNKPHPLYSVPKFFAKAGLFIQNTIPFFRDPFIKPWMIEIGDDHYAVDISKAKEVLGWTPKHFIGRSLPVIIDNLKKDPIEWFKTNQLEVEHLEKDS
jgi:nucleoside-diphosphate-sugar epimerase